MCILWEIKVQCWLICSADYLDEVAKVTVTCETVDVLLPTIASSCAENKSVADQIVSHYHNTVVPIRKVADTGM